MLKGKSIVAKYAVLIICFNGREAAFLSEGVAET
jgi:hypothetical protein